MSEIIFSHNYAKEIDEILNTLSIPSYIIYIDESLNLIPYSSFLKNFPKIEAPKGESGKTIENICNIWGGLSEKSISRHSILFCVGGGSVSDAGGFAAATFKRGISTINIPTTLLAMTDASIGGKTAIDFNGHKNEIGSFHHPEKVIIDTNWLKTLPSEELLSGYGEVLKTALIDSEELFLQILDKSDNLLEHPESFDMLLPRLIGVKERIVASDPEDHGLRHILNFGHTAGHAFESLAISRGEDLKHGIAVAQGMITEMILANMKLGFSSRLLHIYASHFRKHFPAWKFGCNDYPQLLQLMRHDKKNTSEDEIIFSLPSSPGEFLPEVTATDKEIESALDITRDLLSL